MHHLKDLLPGTALLINAAEVGQARRNSRAAEDLSASVSSKEESWRVYLLLPLLNALSSFNRFLECCSGLSEALRKELEGEEYEETVSGSLDSFPS